MKKFLFIVFIVFLFVGCDKTVKVDSIKEGNNSYTVYIEYDNLDGNEYIYAILPSKNMMIVNHYPRQTGIERPKSDKREDKYNLELKDVIKENGEIKSIVFGNYKFIKK